MNRIASTREFWNENPCDGQATYELRSRFRYRKDPWLLRLLGRIAVDRSDVLEVGCGQGTDGLTLCGKLRSGGLYTGVDLSDESLARARSGAAELGGRLNVQPLFQLENAERLSFKDDRFDCVISVGALHHSPNTEEAIREVRRVLAPGGTAYVMLYRRIAPKVMSAHLLRGVQRGIDAAFGSQRSLYRASRALGIGDRGGTAIYECFGVPVLRSYTRRGMEELFRDFSSLRLSSHGRRRSAVGRTAGEIPNDPLGYLWLAEAVK